MEEIPYSAQLLLRKGLEEENAKLRAEVERLTSIGWQDKARVENVVEDLNAANLQVEAMKKVCGMAEWWWSADKGDEEPDAALLEAVTEMIALRNAAEKPKDEKPPYGEDLGPSDRDDHPSVKID